MQSVFKLSIKIHRFICLTIICFGISTTIAYGISTSSPAGGNYLSLNGKDNYAVLDFDTFGELFKERTKDLTVEAWIYPTSEPDKDTYAVVLGQQIFIELISYDNPLYQDVKERIDWKKGDLLLSMFGYTKSMGNDDGIAGTGFLPMTLSPYKWHHIVIQFQYPNTIWICDNQSKPVLQGAKISNISKIAKEFFIPNKSLVVGGYGEKIPIPETKSFFGSFAGYIDEVRISDVARYDITKGQLIPEGRFESDANTIALWHFDESVGTMTFFDSSGHNMNLIGKNGITTRIPFAVNENNKLTTTWSRIRNF